MHEAGKLIVERLGRISHVDYKSAFNIVTDVDKASEALILQILQKEFPGDEILAEESGRRQTGSSRRWLIDPIDGTTNFAHSYPFFCVSIGLEEEGKMIFGVVYNPVSQELFSAESGKGAWLNEKKITVSQSASLSTSLLATGFPPGEKKNQENNQPQFSYLTSRSHGVRRDGSAALDLVYVASGRLDGFWETKLAPWDLAAGTLIVKEAGGQVTALDGTPFDIGSGHVLATNGLIHKEVIQALGEARACL